MRIGPFLLASPLILAPMAGVTDRPFRNLCRRLGAGMAVSEMVSSNNLLWASDKTRKRLDQTGECEPRSVQIAGSDPYEMAAAARRAVELDAQIVDINMGCPAKKVCNRWSGSALLRDEPLVARILAAVVGAIPGTPVTLKIRTGWDRANRNALRIARIAEDTGVQALAVHGRTRADGFAGTAEYDSIAAIKQQAGIPIIANGDIDGPLSARKVLAYTGADALMIGRAAQGRPWIFKQIEHYLACGVQIADPSPQQVGQILLQHLYDLHRFYGEYRGVRVARKHIGWYCRAHPDSAAFRRNVMLLESAPAQISAVVDFFELDSGPGIQAA